MRGALAAVALILVTGCPGNQTGDVSQQSPPRNSTSTAAVSLPRSSSSTPAATMTGATAVQLTEYEIQMPDSLPAGRATFQITNAGKENHNFAIEGPGIASKLTSDLTRGDTQEITLDLVRGTYTVYCPVDGHRGKGMQRTLVVR